MNADTTLNKSFESKLDQYIRVMLEVGVNLQRGQVLILRSHVETASVAKRIVERAYKMGAKYVYVQWEDDQLTRLMLEHGQEDALSAYPAWIDEATVRYFDEGAAIIGLNFRDPHALDGIDPERIRAYNRTLSQHKAPIIARQGSAAINWLGTRVPSSAWAKTVFPNLPVSDGIARLWDLVFAMCRINNDDPVAAWQTHIANLIRRADYLNAKRYSSLHYRAPGTDLRVGLADDHIWIGASMVSQHGVRFNANIPTAEVFTMPHRDRIDGVVSSTMPFNLNGTLVKDMVLQFSEGQVVSAKASAGEDALNTVLRMDQGASSLGEVALVPHSSPISRSGVLFYDTLYDENASCHIALGNAIRTNMRDGATMSNDQLAQKGGNTSMIHVDFMIGSGAIDIDGITPDGVTEPIMRGGEWVVSV
jgi:aminopeptidase